MSLVFPDLKQSHATFTFPRSDVAMYELLRLRNHPETSYLGFLLRRIGIEFAAIPLEQAQITWVSWDDDFVETCVAWEVAEVIGECWQDTDG